MRFDDESRRYIASLGIEPHGTLRETAAILGEILTIEFNEDEDGLYDEFPAFVAVSGDVRFALLGNPDPADDLRDIPSQDFELRVEVADFRDRFRKKDVSAEIAAVIGADGRLICEILSSATQCFNQPRQK